MAGGDPLDSIRVLIGEDQHLIGGALVALLSREDDIDVVADPERGDQMLETAEQARPDVALLDIDMPGLTVAARLHERLPGHQRPGTGRRRARHRREPAHQPGGGRTA